jgi:hypothetical protein
VLIDVSTIAREAGIRYPVALTAAVWAQCVAVPPGVGCQDEAGRLWDVVWMLTCAIHGSSDGASVVRFGVHVRNDNRDHTPPLVRLKAACGPGDHGGPVLTVMLRHEDGRLPRRGRARATGRRKPPRPVARARSHAPRRHRPPGARHDP